jgi:hypothetical protein
LREHDACLYVAWLTRPVFVRSAVRYGQLWRFFLQMVTSPFASRLAAIAEGQHARFQFTNEADPDLCSQIGRWAEAMGFESERCTRVPWSAVFVSWCVKEAGAAPEEFAFSMAHSVFVHQAIANATAGTGVFHGVPIDAVPPAVGDIIQYNRSGNRFDFAFARANRLYESHSVIVIEVGADATGRFAFCVGGNESDSIRRTVVRLTPAGLIQQRAENPFIAHVRTLK